MKLATKTLLLSLLAASQAAAQAGLLVPTSSGAPDAKILSLREMAIDIGMARGYARVNVRQVFENHTTRSQEGTYRFALPPSAAVGDFAVWDGLVRIPGVILEKQRARSIYQALTAQRIDPGLLQQGEEEDREAGTGTRRPSAAALFSVTVAPIPALGTKRLELQFQQEVPFTSRQGEFRLVLKPPDGEPPVAGVFDVRVTLDDADFAPIAAGLPLVASQDGVSFSGKDVRLDRDLVLRLVPRDANALQLSAFRNPDGHLPDGLALAPWERPSEIPPEKDGFFLLEALPPDATPAATNEAGAATAAVQAAGHPRPPVTLAILFDTSLSHRWAGLEASYDRLVRVLQSLGPEDRFAVIPFDRAPASEGVALKSASSEAVLAALGALRERPLAPGTDFVRAVAAARKLAGAGGRMLLLSDGQGPASSRALDAARAGALLFTAVTGGDAGEGLRAASEQVLVTTATSLESDLFFARLLAPPLRPTKATDDAKSEPSGPPFSVSGGDPKLRDVYPVLLQPLAPGALSGWVGRYGAPQASLRWELKSAVFAGGRSTLAAPLPERALDARDLPRRWARARVDFLLALIEREGERREWVDEIIALSKRYKFVTPYTAFLAAPRSLLRPRRIQPGDPVLRVECDPGIVSATALLPFGLRLPLVRRPGESLWEGRFLVPEGLADGRYDVRIVMRDLSGALVSESKSFVLDGRPPVVRPEPQPAARAGESVRVAVRTDEDVILLSARLGDGAPVPLRWDQTSKRSVGLLPVPASLAGRQEIVFEAVDAAKNHGFARTTLEVRP